MVVGSTRFRHAGLSGTCFHLLWSRCLLFSWATRNRGGRCFQDCLYHSTLPTKETQGIAHSPGRQTLWSRCLNFSSEHFIACELAPFCGAPDNPQASDDLGINTQLSCLSHLPLVADYGAWDPLSMGSWLPLPLEKTISSFGPYLHWLSVTPDPHLSGNYCINRSYPSSLQYLFLQRKSLCRITLHDGLLRDYAGGGYLGCYSNYSFWDRPSRNPFSRASRNNLFCSRRCCSPHLCWWVWIAGNGFDPRWVTCPLYIIRI